MILKLPLLLSAFCSSILSSFASAQAPCPAWSPDFGLPGTDDAVRAIATFDDGSGPALYVGGSFTTAGAVAAQHVARWNGVSWSAVGDGFDGDVLCLAVLDDGTGPALYAGGSFTTSGATSTNGIARWNGTSWSSLGGGVTGGTPNSVRALCTFDDGTGVGIYAGGRFTHAGATSVSHLARWKSGSWSNVGNGVFNTGSSTTTDVDALAVYDEGSGPALYVGGYFNVAGAIPAAGIARWSGAHWSALGTGTNVLTTALVVWDDGIQGPALYVGLSSGQIGGLDALGIARWNGAWTPVGFGLGQPGGPSATTYALTVFDDGSGAQLYAGGSFTLADGQPAQNLARFDGQHWTAQATALAAPVRALCGHNERTGAALFVGGDFLAADGVVSERITRRRASGFTSVGSGNGITGFVHTLTQYDSGSGPRLVAGGGFAAAGGVAAKNIAAYDGTTWSPLGSGAIDRVEALAVYDEGHGAGPVLFAGGAFTQVGGVSATFIARWNGSTWSAVSGGTNYEVDSLAVFDDGSGPALYVSGAFTSAGGGATTGNIARWNGTAWSNVGTLPPANISGLTVFDDGSGAALYGYADVYNPPNYHATVYKWDGVSWTQVGSVFDRFLDALHAHGTGANAVLYAGVAGNGPNVLWRLDGANWTPITGLDAGIYPVLVRAMASYDEGLGNAPTLIVAGAFTTAEGLPAVNLARYDGSHWHPFDGNFGTEIPTAGVYALGLFQDPSFGGTALFVGGAFTTGLGAPSTSIAERVGCPGPVTSYCFGDGSLTTPCPCANNGAAGHGCANSSVAAGARLSGSGVPSIASDTLVLTQTDSLAHAFTIVLQGNASVAGGAVFGDGIRCAGGSLKRLYIQSATAGTVVVPAAGDPSISARSSALGDTLAAGSVRNYQAYYRDPVLTFCPSPTGKAFNVGNGVRAVWAP